MAVKNSDRKLSPGRPPKAEAAARLGHILDVAAAEFVSRGFGDASVTRIAGNAGVSKKTIYARYANRDELLLAVVKHLSARSYAQITKAVATPNADPRSVLTEFATHLATVWSLRETVAVYRLIVAESARFPQLSAIYRDFTRPFRSSLADYLRQQCHAGTFEIADVDAAAYQFGMLAYGEIREKGLLGEPVTGEVIAAAASRAVDVFFDGYKLGPVS